MSRILKIAVGVVVTALVVGGAVVVYRETDLLTGSLVLLAGLMIAALVARRAAAREERVGMAEWEEETLASAEAAEDFFGDWALNGPGAAEIGTTVPPAFSPTPAVAPPVPAQSHGPASPLPAGAKVPEPADPSVAVSRPLHDEDEPGDPGSLTSSLFVTDRPLPTEGSVVDDHVDVEVDELVPAPAFAGAGAGTSSTTHSSPIDWTGQGGRVDERVQSSDDILHVSEVTALPAANGAGGSELARLLAKVEARLREYD